MAEYRILNNSRQNSLTIGPDPTPDHSRKPNEAAHGHHFTSQKQTHQWNMSFWGSDECRPSAPCLFFYLQSSCSVVFLSYRSVNFPYQHFLSAAYLDAMHRIISELDFRSASVLGWLYYNSRYLQLS